MGGMSRLRRGIGPLVLCHPPPLTPAGERFSGHTERTFGVRSAAADCHFPPCELARGIFNREHDSQPASWLVTKRQQAAALQSFASRAGHGAR